MATKNKTTLESRAFLLKGDDDMQKQQHLEQLLALMIVPDFADFDLEHMEGDSATCARINAGLGMPPFGSPKRVVLVKYANKINPDEQAKLAVQVLKTPESSCLVLVNPAPDKEDGKPKKGSEVIGDLSKAVRKVGEVIEFGGGTQKERQAKAREHATYVFKNAGKKLGSDALNMFLQRAGSDFAVVTSEAQKLIDYAGEGDVIAMGDVLAVTSETPEEKIFKLVDAIAARNQAGALRLMEELFETSDDPRVEAPKTLSVIARQFRLIWQMKALQDEGVRSFAKESIPDHIKDTLPSDPNLLELLNRQAWQASRLSQQARAFSRNDLIRCFNALAKTDTTIKGIDSDMDDPRLAMDMLAMELARKRS